MVALKLFIRHRVPMIFGVMTGVTALSVAESTLRVHTHSQSGTPVTTPTVIGAGPRLCSNAGVLTDSRVAGEQWITNFTGLPY